MYLPSQTSSEREAHSETASKSYWWVFFSRVMTYYRLFSVHSSNEAFETLKNTEVPSHSSLASWQLRQASCSQM